MRQGRRAGLLAAVVVLAVTVLALCGGPAHATAGTLSASPAPCSPRADNGGCSVSPIRLSATLPAGSDGVVLAWATSGRPAAAPHPTETSVALATASGTCLTTDGVQTCSWAWPRALEASGSTDVLNGTYQVSACTAMGSANGGDPSTSSAAGSTTTTPTTTCTAEAEDPVSFGVSAPPAAPEGMLVAAASSAANAPVTVSWEEGFEPDLAGYQLVRNGTTIYSCSIHGAPGAAPCASRPSYVDRADKSGTVAYGLLAMRYGQSGTDQISSPFTTAAVNLGASGPAAALPPPVASGTPGLGAVTIPKAAPAVTGGGSLPKVTVPSAGVGYGSTLPYRGPAGSVRALTGPYGSTPSSNDVDRLALIAAGLLVLAVAGHVLYLRAAVARYQRAGGRGPSTTAARRPPLRIQWASWPPIARSGVSGRRSGNEGRVR